MNIERYLRLIAGSFVLISAVLAWTVSPWFLAFTAFVGLNLMQSAFTNRCPMITLLRKLHADKTPCATCDVNAA